MESHKEAKLRSNLPQISPNALPVFSFQDKEEEIEKLQEYQSSLAERIFPSSPLDPLPEWAIPLPDLAEKKGNAQQEIAKNADEQKSQMQVQTSQRQTFFQAKAQAIEDRTQALPKTFPIAGFPPAFSQAQKNIEEQSQRIEDEFSNIQGIIDKTARFFKGNK